MSLALRALSLFDPACVSASAIAISLLIA
jgi:hypothetical protein